MLLKNPDLEPMQTLADLQRRLGGVPLERVRFVPFPGTATEANVVAARNGPERRLCELVAGVLVEKPMGFYESRLAAVLIRLLDQYAVTHDVGIVVGADGMMRLSPGLVRIPDVSFVSWERLPNRKLPRAAVPDLAPDLAVEIISGGNTPEEMENKLQEYFAAGVRMVWYVYPKECTARAYTGPDSCTEISEGDALDGGDVLPGFRVALRDWLALAGEVED